MTRLASSSERLAAVVSGRADVVLPSDENLERWETPARGPRGAVSAVALPRTVDDLRSLVSAAREHRVRLIVQGANTGLVGSSVPPADGDEPVVVVDLARCDPVVEIDVGNRTALVSAGTRLAELNEQAAVHGLCLPVDLSVDPAIGGLVSTGAGGSRVVRYGPIKHRIRSMEVVLADRDASLLGRPLHGLAKDSRGTELASVAVGAGGTLGIVTRLVMDLEPMPAATATWWLGLRAGADPSRVFELLDRLRPATISAFELVSANAIACAADVLDVAAPIDRDHDHLLVEWSVPEAPLDGLEDNVAAAFEAGDIVDGVLAPSADAWRVRHAVSESLRQRGVVIGHDVSVPRSRLDELRRRVETVVASVLPAGELFTFGHVGDGGLHLNVVVPRDAEPSERVAIGRLRGEIYDLVAELGGSYSAEHGLGPLNRERWERSASDIERALLRAIKDVVDDRRILGHPAHPYNRV
ncbi:MAG: FAD-binding oxidoreductase [Ilumatobacteraceae bacterium]